MSDLRVTLKLARGPYFVESDFTEEYLDQMMLQDIDVFRHLVDEMKRQLQNRIHSEPKGQNPENN